jgi:hypothetical protein
MTNRKGGNGHGATSRYSAGLEYLDGIELDEVAAWAVGLEAMHARIAERFGRPEPQQRALAYLKRV